MPQMQSPWQLEPSSRCFVDRLQVDGGTPLPVCSPHRARAMLAELQSGLVGRPNVRIEETIFPVGPGGGVRVRIVRPNAEIGQLPVVMYFHGGGWIWGGMDTHDRLVREIAAGAEAAVVFVEMSPAPEERFPVAIEQAFAAAKYVADYGASLGLDGSRLAVMGDGTGGNIAAAVTLMAKDQRGPRIAFQVLLYPVTDANFESESYRTFQDGPWLTLRAMQWFWAAYLPDEAARNTITASPLRATVDQLRSLPAALIITAENDVVREEGEAYARKLLDAGVRVTVTRYIGTIHDFAMLNALADSPATRAAIQQATAHLRTALE